MRSVLFLLMALLAVAGCGHNAHYPINRPLQQHAPDYGYRFENSKVPPDQAGDVLVVLLFSGGGTRAAALAYGTLEALRDSRVIVRGKEHSLLDEADYVSAVSGGSVVAAYYGLYRDRIFTDFGDRFLYRDVQGELTYRLLGNLGRVSSARFGRGDLFAEYLNDQVFDGATYADLVRQPRPYTVISATDMSLGGQFPFSQERFDLLCSDLSPVPVGRAVAASMALPPYFSPITFWNYAGQCGYVPPPWFADRPEADERTRRDLAEMRSYLDLERRPYVHLFDGGLVDNLSLRQPLGVVMRRGGFVPALAAFGFSDVEQLVFISVDAERDPGFELDKSADVPGPGATLEAVNNALNLSSFDSSVLIEESVSRWQEELRAARPLSAPEPKFYLIDVSLRSISDPAERQRFMAIPTTLQLDRNDVDALRALASRLLDASPDYQELMSDIGAPAAR
jgi:NTE family protein